MTQCKPYPNITELSLAVILATEGKAAEVTPAVYDKAFATLPAFQLSGVSFEDVLADLDRAHLIDSDRTLTTLGDAYVKICRTFFAKQAQP